MSQPPIQFKIFIHTLDNTVILHHELGIAHVPLKDLLSIQGTGELSLHPDLVEAAKTSILALARKYNGVEDVKEQIPSEGKQGVETGTSESAQIDNANEKAREVG